MAWDTEWAAEQRGLGDLMARYSEWTEIPPAELLERQKDVEAVIPDPDPDPDRLMPSAVANT